MFTSGPVAVEDGRAGFKHSLCENDLRQPMPAFAWQHPVSDWSCLRAKNARGAALAFEDTPESALLRGTTQGYLAWSRLIVPSKNDQSFGHPRTIRGCGRELPTQALAKYVQLQEVMIP
jgi:hypothetical protein